MNKIKLTTISLVTSALLSGCLSNGTDSTANTGYFIDSQVIGVEYNTTSGLSGLTDGAGRFSYNDGDTVTFSLGKLILGECQPATDGLVTPKTLVVGDESTPTTDQDNTITLMLQTLQSLDSDGDSSNGITIPIDVIDDLSNLIEDIQFDDNLTEDELIELENSYDLGLDEDNDGELDVTSADATSHFSSSEQSWEEGERPDNSESQNGDTQAQDFNIDDYPITENLSQSLNDALAYMGNEERLAYDVYTNVYNFHETNNSIEIKQLTNIAQKSEEKHVGIVQSVVQRYNLTSADLTDVNSSVAENNVSFENMPSGVYDIETLQNLYNILYDLGTQSQEDALKVGCMVEVTDINDLDEYIELAEDSNATDIFEAFDVLRNGSYSHYWSFDKGLKNLGIENGCYVEGDPLLGENKEGIYPTNENSNDGENGGRQYRGGR